MSWVYLRITKANRLELGGKGERVVSKRVPTARGLLEGPNEGLCVLNLAELSTDYVVAVSICYVLPKRQQQSQGLML